MAKKKVRNVFDKESHHFASLALRSPSVEKNKGLTIHSVAPPRFPLSLFIAAPLWNSHSLPVSVAEKRGKRLQRRTGYSLICKVKKKQRR